MIKFTKTKNSLQFKVIGVYTNDNLGVESVALYAAGIPSVIPETGEVLIDMTEIFQIRNIAIENDKRSSMENTTDEEGNPLPPVTCVPISIDIRIQRGKGYITSCVNFPDHQEIWSGIPKFKSTLASDMFRKQIASIGLVWNTNLSKKIEKLSFTMTKFVKE